MDFTWTLILYSKTKKPNLKQQRNTTPNKTKSPVNFFVTSLYFSSHVTLNVIFSWTRNDSGSRQSSTCVQNTPNLTATLLQLLQLLTFKKLTKNSKSSSSLMRIPCLKTPRWIWRRGSEATWNPRRATRISRSWAATAVALPLTCPRGGWGLMSPSVKAPSLLLLLLPASWRTPPSHPTWASHQR